MPSALSFQPSAKTKNQKFRRLNVWAKAMDFVEEIYKFTDKFPSKEIYGLTNQLRRAGTSIALNIAEGSASATDLEFKRFINIAQRSNYEVMCAIEIARRLNYCSEYEKENLLRQSDDISAMLGAFQKKLKADS